MNVFLVGGAVRDSLLDRPVIEKDWVVIGETPESMIEQGFKPVGKDFPVFLHPETHDEYALARTERKTAPGYKGFAIHASPDVSLEQDLIRRDLTINAIAMDEQGNIHDPYLGKKDLENRILRHISPAFSEDPVRILRVARFAARYAHLGFSVADETMELMKQMVDTGETDHLVAERVWAELNKALSEKNPVAFFNVLKACNALQTIFPELDRLFGIPQPAEHHPEIDTGIHSFLCLEQATRLSDKPEVRLAALLHDLGKAETDPNQWPSHHGHEKLGLDVLEKLSDRLRFPKAFKTLCLRVMKYHTHCHRINQLKPGTIVDLLDSLNIFNNKPSLVEDFVLACEADAKGRTGLENNPYPQANRLLMIAQAAESIDVSSVLKNNELQGTKIRDAIRQTRAQAIAQLIKQNA